VVGSPNSSNSNRLRELGERIGAKAYLIDSAEEIQQEWLEGIENIGITAGASAPEVLVQSVVDRLIEWGAEVPEELQGQAESVVFSLPKELRLVDVSE
jgi:4-hydroxy-3-methylbut-2-enyl diphosphate reductase